MIAQLLKHQFIAFRRSSGFEREIVIKVIMGIFLLYMLANLIFLAYMLPNLIKSISGDAIGFLNGLLFYYFIAELVIRYFFQSSPTLNLEPYLHLPIRRGKISLFLQVKSLFHPINFVGALVTGPFAFDVVAPEYELSAAWMWWLSIISISIFFNFLILIFRKKWEDNIIVWIGLVVILGITYLLSSYQILNPASLTGSFFDSILSNPILFIIPLVFAIGTGFFSYNYFKNNLYIESSSSSKTSGRTYTGFSFLNSYGISGLLILQEIKLIVRHKRSRTFLVLSGIFLFYGLIFLDDYTGGFSPVLIFIGIFVSGIFPFNYGQLLWGWKTNLLDFYFTRPFALEEIIRGLYRLLAASCIICGFLSIPYVYFGWEVLFVFMSCMIFNIGINVPLVMALSMWKPSAMDIDKSAFFNYQGVGPAQWLLMVPVMGLPFAIYFLVSWLSTGLVAVVVIAIIGLMAILSNKLIIRWLTIRLHSQKYILIENLSL